MDLKFSKIVDREKKKIDMFVYGALGDASGEVNGHYFAQELNWVGRNYDEITVRVNCEGGDVLHGLSIISEMMISPAYIIASVDGVAASMGAVLLAAADKVIMNDYAKVMIHSPYYVDENGDAVKNLTDKAKKGLNSIKDILMNLLKKRGITDARVVELMKADSWFSADEALTEKLVDEVIPTGRKAELVALEPLKLVAKLKQENTNSNFISMKKVIAKLNGFGLQLPEDANEDQVVAAMVGLQIGGSEKPAQKLVDQLIAIGKKTGAVTEGETGNEAKFRKLAEADMELFVDLLGIDQLSTAPAPKAPQARMSDLIAQAKNNKQPAADAASERDFAWYEKNDPKTLAKMEQTEPEKFAKLQAADQAKYE